MHYSVVQILIILSKNPIKSQKCLMIIEPIDLFWIFLKSDNELIKTCATLALIQHIISKVLVT